MSIFEGEKFDKFLIEIYVLGLSKWVGGFLKMFNHNSRLMRLPTHKSLADDLSSEDLSKNVKIIYEIRLLKFIKKLQFENYENLLKSVDSLQVTTFSSIP